MKFTQNVGKMPKQFAIKPLFIISIFSFLIVCVSLAVAFLLRFGVAELESESE